MSRNLLAINKRGRIRDDTLAERGLKTTKHPL